MENASPPRYEVIQELTKADHRRIFWLHWKNTRPWITLAILLAGLTLLTYVTFVVGDDSIGHSLALGFFSALFYLYLSTLWAIYRRGIQELELIQYQVRLVIDENHLSQTSSYATVIFPWASIILVRRQASAWLFYLKPGDYFGIPTRHLTAEMQEFLKDRVRQTGGKVL